MKFSKVKAVRIPEGTSSQIREDGKVLWKRIAARYVSLGDSIAAGHTINDDWEKDYGEKSQYGVNGNTYTTIVPGSYTDLIRNDLVSKYGADRVKATSFARSGDTVAMLMEKLTHETVVNEIKEATIVTICIGANDVLQPAMSHLGDYINTGDLSSLEAIVEGNLNTLNTDSSPTSYRKLFDKLTEINPKAKVVFTAVYNPYKYLYIEDGHYGFFRPIMEAIPSIEILGFDIDSLIKDSLLGTPAVQMLFNRVNGLGDWAEKYVSRLNQVLRNKISEYQTINPNFALAETKALYDTFPDRPVTAPKHYNDLVNVEYTRDYNTATMDWGRLWPGSNAGSYWLNLATKYTSLSGLDIEGMAAEFVAQMIERVIVPDVDPHPETYGQYVLKRDFADALGLQALDYWILTYDANGGTGKMETQYIPTVDGLPSYINLYHNTFTAPEGHYITGWNTEPDGSGSPYSLDMYVGIAGIQTMYAQWSNIYTVTVHHSMDSAGAHGSGDTGPMECYALWIDGTEQADLGAFSNPARTYRLPYGTSVGVIAQTKSGDARSYVSWDGTTVAGKSSDARWGFTVTSDLDIHFEWNYWLEDILFEQSYWNCYITTK